MPTSAGCRIGKVRFKDGSSDLVLLPTHAPPDCNGISNTFIESLVHVLACARQGQVMGYAVVCMIEEPGSPDGCNVLQVADVAHLNGGGRLAVLGAIRLMERDYVDGALLDADDDCAYVEDI